MIYIVLSRETYGSSPWYGIHTRGRMMLPLPPQYAHPVVLDRMIRAIKKGNAVTVEQSYEYMKDELRRLNKDVEVSQKEYDEVAAVKPMFLISNYE